MRNLLISIVAAATVLTAAPAFAQSFRIGDDGVSFRVGRDHGDWGYRRHYGWRGDDCRDVTIRKRTWDGSVVTRHIRRCD
jgi:hypothetical protein